MSTKVDVISRLDKLPEVIKKAETSLMDLKDLVEEKKVLIKQKEQEIMHGVLSEKEEGKLKFTNQIKRDIAFETRKGQDMIWCEIVQEIKGINKKISEQIIGLDFLKNKFRAARSMVELLKGD